MELPPTIHEDLDPDQDIALQLLNAEISQQSHGGPSVEPQTAAMFSMLHMASQESSVIRDFLQDAANASILHRNVSSGAAVSALRTNLVNYFTLRYEERGQTFSDHERVSAFRWAEPFDLFEQDLLLLKTGHESMAMNALQGGLYREAATPPFERSAITDLVTQITADRYDTGIRALDVGSSLMIGALQLAYKRQYPMSFDKVSINLPGSLAETDVTDKAKAIVARPSLFKEIVCIDSFAAYSEARQKYDAGNAQFALSGLRPNKRGNPAYMDRVRGLMAKKDSASPDYDPNSIVKFSHTNPLNPAELAAFKERHPGQFDLITLDYVTQELSPPDQVRMHQIALGLLSPVGILMYKHQAFLRPWNVTQPAEVKNIAYYNTYATVPYRSNMHIVDNMLPKKGVQEPMTSYDNRFDRVRIKGGKLVVNGAIEPIPDLVKHS